MAEQIQDNGYVKDQKTSSFTSLPWYTAAWSWLSRNLCSAKCSVNRKGTELLWKILSSSLIRGNYLVQAYVIPYTTAYVDFSRFIYPSIDSYDHEFRLLYLLPGSRDARISCKLLTASLKDKPNYEALSYVWGDASNRRNIILNGYTFSITENLEGALRHLRRSDKKRVLWVDALCINQGDYEEKQQQIQKMRDIYHSAQHVLAWTGEADDESDEALELLENLSKPEVFVTLYELASKPDAFSTISFNRKWQTLFRFLNRPYWSRVWIVQELAIPGMSIYGDIESRKVQLGAGWTWILLSSFNVALMSFALNLRSLVSSPAYLYRPEWPINQATPAAILMFEVVQSCIETPASKRCSIDTLLRMTHFLKATDPRDRVYALIALARDADHVLAPEYSISMTQMLRTMVRHLIVVDKNLAALSGNRRLRLSTKEWSSWIPDPERYIHCTRSDWQPETTSFKACTSIAPAVTFSSDISLLTVKGIIVDKISTVIGPVDSETFPGLASNDLSQSAMMQCLQQLEQFGSTLSKSRREIFWRTLVLDSEEVEHGKRKSPAPKILGEWFEAMLGNPSASPSIEQFDAIRRFYQQVGIAQRCFYTTSTGEMGLGPFDTLPGDLVTILYGGQFCYILREVGEHYVLIGDSYLHGAMHGELQRPERKLGKESSEERNFVLR